MGMAFTSTLCVVASGDTPAPTSPRDRLVALIREFDSPAIETRMAASLRAESDAELSLKIIEDQMLVSSGASLSAEQLLRLDRAAFAKFAGEARAALGVQFSQLENIADGVEISAPLDGFDSKRALQAGDIIHKIDAITVHRQEQMRAAIVSYSPGDEVTLGITRQGEELQVKLRMGSFADLDNRNGMLMPAGGGRVRNNLQPRASQLDSITLNTAWKHRRTRLGGGTTGLIRTLDTGLSQAQWDGAERAGEAAAQPRGQAAANQNVILRQGQGQIENDWRFEPGPLRGVSNGGSGRRGYDSAVPNFAAGVVVHELNDKSVQLNRDIQRLRSLINEHTMLIARRPEMPARERKMLESNAATLRQQLMELERQSRQLGAMPGNPATEVVVP